MVEWKSLKLTKKLATLIVEPAIQLRFGIYFFIVSLFTALFVQRMIFDHIRDSIVEFYHAGDNPDLILQWLDPSMVIMGWNFLFLFLFLGGVSFLLGAYTTRKLALKLNQIDNETELTEKKTVKAA